MDKEQQQLNKIIAENLSTEDKERIFHYIDLIIRDNKTGQAYASR